MTIYDISEKAGVSIATVSRVLNGSSSVSEKTKKKVLDVINQYEYTPNAFARGLGLNTMKTIGIICADSSDLYLAKAVYYIEQKLRANDYDSILCCTGYDLDAKAAAVNLLITKKVDGIILVGSNFIYEEEADNRYVAEAAAQLPLMLLNAALDAPNVYSVISDDYTSMYEATLQMISTGIRDIVYFYNSTSYSGKKKLAGYLAAMEEKKLSPESGLLQFYQGSHEDIPAMTEHLMELHRRGFAFHGVIASDDTLALAAVKYAKLMGYSIPGDFSILGYNNSMLVNCCDPELTSIDNKLETLCQHLITTLLGVLDGNDMPKKTVFSGEIIRRGTTRA
ncbi:MAG: LacI family transcriptional regulator [Butyrivibrio sp.]|nr:LacI family transcriptional regulator [Acetatifactor muris]MCM1558307.1 LacI family transcriptional regulator [Butyrivibrio sp.]